MSYGSLFWSSTQAKNCKHKTTINSQIFHTGCFFCFLYCLAQYCVKTLCHKSWQRSRKPSTSHVKGVILWSISSCHQNRSTSVFSQYCNTSYHRLHFYHITLYYHLSSIFLCHCNQKHTRALQLMIPLNDWSPFNFKRRRNISIFGIFQLKNKNVIALSQLSKLTQLLNRCFLCICGSYKELMKNFPMRPSLS